MTEYKEDIVRTVLAAYEKCREERRPIELQWRLNANFLAGNQYAEITAAGNIESYGKQYFWQERESYNHIAPIIETRLAKLGRVKAGVSVRPFSGDDSDIATAKISTSVLKTLQEENGLSELVTKANMWSETTGSVFYKTEWDKDKGTLIGRDKKKNPIYEGDIAVSVCPPYEIYPDSITAESVENCKFIIHARVFTVEEIEDMWGVSVTGGEVEIFSLNLTETAGGLGYSATAPNLSGELADGRAVVLEQYIAPTRAYPNGRLHIVAGQTLLYSGELPYVNGINGARCMPFARQVALEKVGSFFGTSVIERLIPIQRAYNGVKNRKHEFLNRISMGILAVEDGSVDVESLEDEGLPPGKIMIYRQGSAPPKMMEYGAVPIEFAQEESRLLNEFISISGVSEFMKYGKIPSNVASGIALSLVAEQDDTRLSVSADSVRCAVKTVGTHMLRIYRQMIKSRRLMRIAGDNGEVQLQYFTRSDLAAEDIVFDTDNELSDTPANRKNMVMELVKMGLLNDEDGKMPGRMRLKVLEMLGLGNWENGRDIDECHRRKAQAENMDADRIELLEVDAHDIHVDEHVKAVISGALGKSDKAMLEHIRAHKSFAFMQNSAEAQS